MSSAWIAAACALPKAPSYFKGKATVGRLSLLMTLVRSLQHKLLRRGEWELLKRCVALQVLGGFPSAFADYCGTVVCEDIGLAQPGLVRLVLRVIQQCRQLSAPFPLDPARVQRLLQLQWALARALASAPKSRFVPELRSLALLRLAVEETKLEVPLEQRLQRLRQAIAVCRAQSDLSPSSPLVIQAVAALVEARVQIGGHGAVSQLWACLSPGPVVSALQQLHNRPGCGEQLPLQMALLVSCLRLEQEPEPALPEAKEEIPEDLESLQVPEYARDKHAGGSGGYERFYAEGIWAPPESRWRREEDEALRVEALQLRLSVEARWGPGSSKSSKVMERVRQQKGWAQASRKRKQ